LQAGYNRNKGGPVRAFATERADPDRAPLRRPSQNEIALSHDEALLMDDLDGHVGDVVGVHIEADQGRALERSQMAQRPAR
jgi:hypothetical protein